MFLHQGAQYLVYGAGSGRGGVWVMEGTVTHAVPTAVFLCFWSEDCPDCTGQRVDLYGAERRRERQIAELEIRFLRFCLLSFESSQFLQIKKQQQQQQVYF